MADGTTPPLDVSQTSSEGASPALPRSGWGGYRPGAGRKLKRTSELDSTESRASNQDRGERGSASIAPPAPEPLCPIVSDTVWFGEEAMIRGGLTLIPRAAFVTGVAEPGSPSSMLSLTVFSPSFTHFQHGVRYSAKLRKDCWTWPVRSVCTQQPSTKG